MKQGSGRQSLIDKLHRDRNRQQQQQQMSAATAGQQCGGRQSLRRQLPFEKQRVSFCEVF